VASTKFADIPSIFYVHDLSEGHINWHGDVKAILGVDESQINTRDKFLKLLEPKDKKSYQLNMNNLVDEISCEYSIISGAGEIHLREVAIKTRSNGKSYLQGIITQNEPGKTRAGEGKYNIAGRSILTGKFDSSFLDSLRKFYHDANKNKQSYILLLVSMDNLPMIITWQGDDVANSVMTDLGEKIKKELPPESTLLRINSDQFGIIIKNPTANEIDVVVNNISKQVSLYKHPKLEDAVHLRLSVGSVNFPLGVKDEIDIINKAYLALTNAKGKGYEFYCDFEDAKRDHIDAQNEMAQLHYLQEAFNENRIVIAYQPVISTKDGSATSYECLLRISNGNGRYESAGRLIGVAEKMGTVETIDEFVLKTAVEELKRSKAVNVSVNVSNLTTSSEQWLKMCAEVLSDESVASRITFEITETAAQKDLRKTAYFTAAIQGLGCQVSLDDFGVGFTSFRQLRSLSINSIKIDGSFVLGLEENKENLLFIRSLVDFGRSYGLKTVAECVETGEVAKKLIDLGVDYMQGYYFGAPDVNKPWDKVA
jgi:diguanylate cyclase (GGDEF)-like protein